MVKLPSWIQCLLRTPGNTDGRGSGHTFWWDHDHWHMHGCGEKIKRKNCSKIDYQDRDPALYLRGWEYHKFWKPILKFIEFVSWLDSKTRKFHRPMPEENGRFHWKQVCRIYFFYCQWRHLYIRKLISLFYELKICKIYFILHLLFN